MSGNDDWHLAFLDFCQATQVEPNIKVGVYILEKDIRKVVIHLPGFDQLIRAQAEQGLILD